MVYDIVVRPSLRKHIFLYVVTISLIAASSVLYFLLMDFGLFILIPVSLFNLFLIVNVLYTIAFTRSFTISMEENVIEFKKGVFLKTLESIDMHRIKDYVKKQGFIDQILGLSDVIIHSTDFTTPKLTFEGLDQGDAKRVIKFLQAYSSDSIIKHYINRSNDVQNDGSDKMMMDHIINMTDNNAARSKGIRRKMPSKRKPAFINTDGVDIPLEALDKRQNPTPSNPYNPNQYQPRQNPQRPVFVNTQGSQHRQEPQYPQNEEGDQRNPRNGNPGKKVYSEP